MIAEREGTILWEEGCLSVVDYTAEVRRSAEILLKAWTVDQQEIEIEADGLLAVALQHELDHLDGKLFIDRISALKRDSYKRKIKQMIRDGVDLDTYKPSKSERRGNLRQSISEHAGRDGLLLTPDHRGWLDVGLSVVAAVFIVALVPAMRYRVVFFGTPEFAVPSLQALLDGPDEVVGVVCQPDRPAGRGQQLQAPPVKQLAAERAAVPVAQPVKLKTDELPTAAARLGAGSGVVAAYGRILPRADPRAAARSAASTCTPRCCPSTAARRRSSGRS